MSAPRQLGCVNTEFVARFAKVVIEEALIMAHSMAPHAVTGHVCNERDPFVLFRKGANEGSLSRGSNDVFVVEDDVARESKVFTIFKY